MEGISASVISVGFLNNIGRFRLNKLYRIFSNIEVFNQVETLLLTLPAEVAVSTKPIKEFE